MTDSDKNVKESEMNVSGNKVPQKRVRKAKGTATISPLTATLVATYALWLSEHLSNILKNKGSLDLENVFKVTVDSIDENVLFDNFKEYAAISSTFMVLADVFEKLIFSTDPKDLTLLAYFLARQLFESNGTVKSMGIKKFNEEFFRNYFKDIEKIPAYRKQFIKLLGKSNSNNKTLECWKEKTFAAIQRDYRRLLKLGAERQEREQPKLYQATIEKIEQFFKATNSTF
jgi:hypothetical protein